MKLSQILFKQHIGRQIRSAWYIKGKVTPQETVAANILKSRGIEVINSEEFLKPKRDKIDFKSFEFLVPKAQPLDETHPNWKERPCLIYEDNDLLVEGVPQAQQLTKTILFEDSLPNSVESLVKDLPQEINQLVERSIQSSVIFDAYQELLPKIKDPSRPAWVYPRQMGITDVRKTSNLSKKLIQLCDCICGPRTANSRSIIDNALLCLPFEKEFYIFKFLLTMDIILMSENSLKPTDQVNKENQNSMKLPNLHPLHYSLGLNQNHIYEFENLSPLTSGCNKQNIHTIFVYYDKTKVKNKTELAVTESQIIARGIIKAFTAAASSARVRFGSDVKELPEPVTVQCIQSDGKAFYFYVYQLNTLNINGEEQLKNYCWRIPKLNLYETGGYVEGRPVLEGYNPEVFKRILAFYKNN